MKINRYKIMDTWLLKRDRLVTLTSLSLLLIACTGYYFLNAQNNDKFGGMILLVLLFVTLPMCFFQQNNTLGFNKKIYFSFWSYLTIGLISVMLPPTDLASTNWFLKSFFRILIMVFIIQLIWGNIIIDRKRIRYLVSTLCIVLGGAAIFTGTDLLIKQNFHYITPLPIVSNTWNEKAFSFYMVFLMWVSVAYLWRRSIFENITAVIIAIVTTWVVFLYRSESSQLSLICGLIVFGLAHIPIKKNRYWVYLFFFMIFLILPLLWVIFSPIMHMDAMSVFTDHSSFFRNHWNIGSRLFLNDFSADFVRNKILIGHGFGSTLSITFPKDLIPGLAVPGRMPGGHPHNIVFLFLIDHGLLGYLWLVGMLFVLFDFLYYATLDGREAPALWALVISGQIIFSLSFSVWDIDVVLTYGFFFIFLILVSKVSGYTGTTFLREKVFRILPGLVLIIFLCHIINFIL